MRVALCMVFATFVLIGCTKSVKHDVAVFDLAPGKVSQPAPASGKYAIKIAPPG